MDFEYIKKLEIPLTLVVDRKLTDREVIMLALLGKMCQKTAELVGAFFIKLSTGELRNIIGKSDRTVSRTLKSLKDKGFIRIQYFEIGDTRKIIHLRSKAVEALYGMKNYEEAT